MDKKIKAPRNRTITLEGNDIEAYTKRLLQITRESSVEELTSRTINQDLFTCLNLLPNEFVDLMFIDPPYNLNKTFNSNTFKETSDDNYAEWLDSWMAKLVRILKRDASVYVCCDWKSTSAVYSVLKKHFIVRNRITWEREKGRGAKTNWKNCSEDIWFATLSNDYYFNPDAVKMKKRVIAPYRDDRGKPKDWEEAADGNFRLTFPSNLWTDISIPFWSMPENTEHPTQKPEKLVAKILLASTKEDDFIFDPFLGSGTTSVVAKKLNRRYCGVEVDKTYCLFAEKRLAMADTNKSIQGYSDGVFWERNSLKEQNTKIKKPHNRASLFSEYDATNSFSGI
jgi:site-specific DNA-methyltransferase (adenine-specific)